MKKILTPLKYLLSVFFLLGIGTIAVHAQSLDRGLTVSPVKYSYDVAPGETIEDQITLYNASLTSGNVFLYGRNFTSADTSGSPLFIDSAMPIQASLKDWITFEKKSVFLKKIERDNSNAVIIKFKITVPLDAEPGGHYAGIFISFDNPDKPIVNSGNLAFRADPGALVLLNVKGDVTRELSVTKFFTDDPFSAKKVMQSIFEWFPVGFYTEITDKGNSHSVPVGNIIIYQGDAKVESLTFNATSGAVLRESSRVFEDKTSDAFISFVPDLQPGTQTPVLDEQGNIKTHVEMNLDNIRSIFRFGQFKAKLIAGYDDSGDKKILLAETDFWVIPWKLLIIVILIIVVVVFAISKYKSWRKKRRAAKKLKKMAKVSSKRTAKELDESDDDVDSDE